MTAKGLWSRPSARLRSRWSSFRGYARPLKSVNYETLKCRKCDLRQRVDSALMRPKCWVCGGRLSLITNPEPLPTIAVVGGLGVVAFFVYRHFSIVSQQKAAYAAMMAGAAVPPPPASSNKWTDLLSAGIMAYSQDIRNWKTGAKPKPTSGLSGFEDGGIFKKGTLL